MILLTIIDPVFGQKEYRKGYVVLNNSTVVEGLLKAETEGGKIVQVLYKKPPYELASMYYTTEDLRAFRYKNGSRYVTGKTLVPETENFFVESLFVGIVGLYTYSDEENDYYILFDRDKNILRFNLMKDSRGGNDTEALALKKNAGMILKSVMEEITGFSSRIDNMQFDKLSLAELAHDYHVAVKGSEGGINFELSFPKVVITPSAIAGYKTDLIMVDGKSPIADFKIESYIYPNIGLSVNSIFPGFRKEFSLAFDMVVSRRYIYGYYLDNGPDPLHAIHNELHFHQYLLDANIIARYYFGGRILNPYVSGGIATRTLLSEDSRIDSDDVTNEIVVSTSEPYKSSKKFWPGATLGIGMKYETMKTQSVGIGMACSFFLGDADFSYVYSAGITIFYNF